MSDSSSKTEKTAKIDEIAPIAEKDLGDKSDVPDQRTQTEAKDAIAQKSKAPTPLERSEQYQRQHIEALSNHAEFHREECDKWKQEVDKLQDQLMKEKDKEIEFGKRISKLEEIVFSMSFLNLLAYLLTIIGAILVGVAGAAPNLSDAWKFGLTSAGLALTLAGLCVATFVFFISKRAKTKD